MTNPRDDLMVLAPCPFCGGEAERIDIPTVGSDPDLGGDPNDGGSCISCKRCAASTALHFDRKENLYGSWNDRIAASRPATQVVDREAVARLIVGPRLPVPSWSQFTLEQLQKVRWDSTPTAEQKDALNAADAILSLFRPAKAWDSATSPGMTDLMISPESLDAVGEPVAWRWRSIFNAHSYTYSHGPKEPEYHEQYINEPLYTHPPKSTDTSAAVIQSHALKQALDCLSEIAGAHTPDCPAHYAGEELAWAQRHVGSLRLKAEIARDGIAAAIRQLPTSKD